MDDPGTIRHYNTESWFNLQGRSATDLTAKTTKTTQEDYWERDKGHGGGGGEGSDQCQQRQKPHGWIPMERFGKEQMICRFKHLNF